MGLTPLEVIEAATANGCETLGKQAPLSGIIKDGYDADILILNENPLKNVSILGNAKKIKMVLKGGEIVKNTINRGNFVFHFFTLGHLVKPVLNTFLGRNLKTIYYW